MGKQIQVGGLPVGGGAPVSIQSMTNTPTHDVEATVAQIRRLAAAGCQIVRVAVPNLAAAKAVGKIKEAIDLPLVVDIHFDYRLAIAAIESGADKIRINPGNIGARERVKTVVDKAKEYGIPIRVGLRPEKHPHPHRGQRGLPGKAHSGQVRRGHAPGHGGLRLWPHRPAQPVRL